MRVLSRFLLQELHAHTYPDLFAAKHEGIDTKVRGAWILTGANNRDHHGQVSGLNLSTF